MVIATSFCADLAVVCAGQEQHVPESSGGPLDKVLCLGVLARDKGPRRQVCREAQRGQAESRAARPAEGGAPVRQLLVPEDEGKTLLDEHVDSVLKRVPDLESLIQHTLQFRSLLISTDQSNAVDINLTVPATREFMDKVFTGVAEEFEDDPEGSWLNARPQEVRSIVAASIKQTIDSYLPYVKKQLDAIAAINSTDAGVVEDVIDPFATSPILANLSRFAWRALRAAFRFGVFS